MKLTVEYLSRQMDRFRNEDNLLIRLPGQEPVLRTDPDVSGRMSAGTEKPLLFAVLDGVGGTQCGEEAALCAAAALAECPLEENGIPRAAQEAVEELNASLTTGNGFPAGASTLAAALVTGSMATVWTLGDSPVYLIRGGRCLRVSEPHVKPADRWCGFSGPRITRFLGMDTGGAGVEELCGKQVLQLHAGDGLLLCSDGFVEFFGITARHYPRVGTWKMEIFRKTLRTGFGRKDRDNLTAVLITAADEDGTNDDMEE